MPIQQMLLGAGAITTKTYVDDLFTTNLYVGDGANSRTITTGLDLSTEGGMTWLRDRGGNVSNMLFDTVRGARKPLNSGNNGAEQSYPSGKSLTGWTTTGFTLGTNHNTENWSGYDYVNWNFRESPGFFDIVTFTQASGTPTNQRISHSLGSAPGMIWMKCTSGTRDWFCYHRSLGKDKYFKLNSTGAAANATNGWGTSEPDATEFGFNAYEFGLSTGSTYIAYLFAHDVQSFGEGGDQSIIKCGTFSRSGSLTDVDIGFEPQFVFHTMYEGPSSRGLVDNMRGFFTTDNSRFLKAHTTNAENNTVTKLISAKGFAQGGDMGNYIYMAIRRPDGYVGKPVELGTDVFAMDGSGGGAGAVSFISNFPVDFGFTRKPAATQNWYTGARVLKDKYLATNTNGDANTDPEMAWDYNNGFVEGGFFGHSDNQAWMWKRHAGFDVVCYTGDDVVGRQIPHSLNKTAEMIWIKNRDSGASNAHWRVYHKGLNGGTNPATKYLILNDEYQEQDSAAYFNDTEPTSTNFTVGSHLSVNNDGDKFIAMLFASTDVSKVGYYSGNNSGQTITTGFQPRFIIIKSLSYNSWFVFDTVRGWSQNNQDWYLRLEGNYAQSDHVNDRPDDIGHPLSTGFYLKGDTNNDLSATNKTGTDYIYYCHA